MGFIKNKNLKEKCLPTIFPLSPKQNLSEKDMGGIDVYKRYLFKAFSEPSIRNILITGEYGVGKSSIIRSFEKDFIKTRKKKSCNFLYVSLGDYTLKKDNTSKINENSKNNGNKIKASNNKQRNFAERRLLLQIYARFRQTDLPASCFKPIQEYNWIYKFVIPCVCASIALIFLLFNFYGPLSNLSSEAFNNIDKVKFWDTIYIFIIILVTLSVFFVTKKLFPKLQTQSINIKVDSLEAHYESSACESYLDQHATEIVYCLEQISKKINYTVIFEDLDRLDINSCLEIFTRLREINYLVNLRLSSKNKQLRFIYVASDQLLCQFMHSKFFDYVLPIYKRLNSKTAVEFFINNLNTVNNEFNKENNEHIHIKRANHFVSLIASYMSDYRLQYTVLNDYGMFLRLYASNNPPKNNIDMEDISLNILALAVYKNFFPKYYCNFWEGKGNILTDSTEEDSVNVDTKLLNELHSHLSIPVLYYIGFHRNAIISLYKEQLEENLQMTLSNTKPDDSELISALTEQCGEILSKISDEIPDNTIESLKTRLLYMIENNYSDWNWLFNKKFSVTTVIMILSNIDSDDKLNKLFELAGLNKESNISLFQLCDGFERMGRLKSLSPREQNVLVMGTGKNYNGNVKLTNNLALKDLIANYYRR